jgi:hypothetical protein
MNSMQSPTASPEMSTVKWGWWAEGLAFGRPRTATDKIPQGDGELPAVSMATGVFIGGVGMGMTTGRRRRQPDFHVFPRTPSSLRHKNWAIAHLA